MAYEVRNCIIQPSNQTPLGIKKTTNLKSIGCLFILLAFTYGLLNYFDQAENGFISAYRQHPIMMITLTL
jgi:uracil phosphoribosyltransferase